MARTYTNLMVHFIFSTKHREPTISSGLAGELYAYMGGIFRNHRSVLIAAGGMADHVHLLSVVSPVVAPSELIRMVKGDSSRWINDTRRVPGHFGWQRGYGGFSVSESQKMKVMDYIARQEEHHRKKTFQEEYVEFLVKHGIRYDERYLWD